MFFVKTDVCITFNEKLREDYRNISHIPQCEKALFTLSVSGTLVSPATQNGIYHGNLLIQSGSAVEKMQGYILRVNKPLTKVRPKYHPLGTFAPSVVEYN